MPLINILTNMTRLQARFVNALGIMLGQLDANQLYAIAKVEHIEIDTVRFVFRKHDLIQITGVADAYRITNELLHLSNNHSLLHHDIQTDENGIVFVCHPSLLFLQLYARCCGSSAPLDVFYATSEHLRKPVVVHYGKPQHAEEAQ